MALKRELKRLFFQTSIQDAPGDSAKLWRALKRLWKKDNNKNGILSIDDKTDPLEIVQEINEYFANIGAKLAQENIELQYNRQLEIQELS